MSGLPVEYEFAHNPTGEVTPNDRDRLSERLNAAYAAGDLTLFDYQTRLQTLFDATKRADLVPVLSGLPGQYRSDQPVLGGDQPGRPGQVEPLRPAPRGLILAAGGAAVVLVVLIVLLVILL